MKFSLFTILSISLLAVVAPASAQTENPDTAVFNKIRQAEMSDSHLPVLAHYLTDVAGPRLAHSAGYRRAAEWAVKTMKGWGLTNSATEPWGEFGKQWDIENFSLSMIKPYVTPLRAYPTPWSPNTNGLQKGAVVVISGQQYLDTAYMTAHAADFARKFVLLCPEKPVKTDIFAPPAKRFADTALSHLKDFYMVPRKSVEREISLDKIIFGVDMILKRAGALGLILSSNRNANGVVVVSGVYGFRLTSAETLPQAEIAIEDALKMKRLIKSGHPVEIALELKASVSTSDTKGYNVVAEIPGSDPKLKSQVVMLGGHLDSWAAATGATDNGAGCIVMMEAVRLLDSLGIKPKRTIRIALWDGEEEGLFGSYNYVKNHFIDVKTFTPKPEQEKISAYFNLDNGTGKIRGIYAQNNNAVVPIFTQWLQPFHDLGATTVSMSNTGSTDHLAFDWAGIPGFQFIQDELDYESRTHHSELDDYDHLQFDDLKQAAIIVASFVYQTSIRPEKLPRKPLKKEVFVFDGL